MFRIQSLSDRYENLLDLGFLSNETFFESSLKGYFVFGNPGDVDSDWWFVHKNHEIWKFDV